MTSKKVIAITAGDPLGIGPEITVKALKKFRHPRFVPLVIGNEKALKKSGWNSNLSLLLNISEKNLKISPRRPAQEGGLESFKSLKTALKLLKFRRADALVTAPISKEAWELAGIKYAGHTDFFRKKFKTDPLMCFNHHKINAALLTEHIPLAEVSAAIDKKLILRKAVSFADSLKFLGIRKPKICLAGINPHSGDGGIIGREEIENFAPAIKLLRKRGINITGPCPPEKAWLKHINGDFDGILSSYHDQALIPLKIIAKGHSFVHWTYGLDFIRTSPAHGTAFDIAGLGKADAEGMLNAVKFALMLSLKTKG